MSAQEWVGMATTFSDHQRMGPQRLATLQQQLMTAIEKLGGTVRTRGGTCVRLVRRT